MAEAPTQPSQAAAEQIDSSAGYQPAAHDAPTTTPAATDGAPATPTDAELQLRADAEKAKTQLVDEINKLKVDDESALADMGEGENEDPRVVKFSVQNPVKIGGHVKYTVTGLDDEGEFTEVRRFREFHAVGQVLRTRWPGCYVPSIPEKKLVN